MNKKQSKKFLVIFLPIIALAVAIISIVGGVVASNKANPVLEVIGKEGVTTGESSEEEVVEEKTYTISGCTFSGKGTHLVVKSGTNYIVEDCTFSGKEGETSTGSAIKVEGGTLTLNNSTVENVNYNSAGAGIYIYQDGTAVLNSVNIKNCTANSAGGGILNQGTLKLNGDTLIEQCYGVIGSAVYDDGVLFEITGKSTIKNKLNNTHLNSDTINFGVEDNPWSGEIYDEQYCFVGNKSLYINTVSGAKISNFSFLTVLNVTSGELEISNFKTNVKDKTPIVVSGGKLTISDATIDGIKSDKDGGAIKVEADGELTLNNVNITNCELTSTTTAGAGIFNEGTLNLCGTTTLSGHKGLYRGGAVYNSGTLNIKDSVEITTSEAIVGGGIYNYQGTVNFTGTPVITGNKATSDGAGLYSYQGTIVDTGKSTLTSNIATNNGGGIYADGGSINLSEACIISNQAEYGGGVYFRNFPKGKLNLGLTTFFDNMVTQYGGAISLFSSNMDFAGSIYGGSDTESKNVSGENADRGGALYISEGSTFSMIGSSLISNCTSTEYGGVLYEQNNCVFNMKDSSVISSNSSKIGGAMFIQYGTVNIDDNAKIEYNSSTDIGGAICANNNAKININSGTISNNAAATNGGALWSENITLNIGDNATFSNNTAVVNGGAICVNNIDASSSIGLSTFISNSANEGGAISIINGAPDSIETKETSICIGASFYGNKASQNGGAVYSNNSGVYFTGNIYGGSDNSSLLDVNNAENGGGIYSTKILVLSENAQILNCKADFGGGIYSKSKLILNTSTLSNNHATSGGALYVAGNNVKINDNQIVNIVYNKANYGGGIYSSSTTISTSNGSSLNCNNNISTVDGGGIYSLWSTISTSNGSSLNCNNNTATENGGGIYSYNNTELLGGCVISGNSANKGAGIYSAQSLNLGETTLPWNGSISNNSATDVSGANVYSLNGLYCVGDSNCEPIENVCLDTSRLYNKSGTIEIKNIKFINPLVKSITVQAGTLMITDSTISGISATSSSGAAVYVESQATLVLNNTNITNCSVATGSYYGGAIYNLGICNIKGTSTFSLNKADYKGGAIYNAGTLNICDNVVFLSNSAAEGAGIFNEAGKLNITGMVKFDSNDASTTGGGIYSVGGMLNIGDNVEFISNTSKSSGAGLAVSNAEASKYTIGAAKFKSNTSETYGGAIFISNSATEGVGSQSDSLNISAICNDNSSNTHGGAIYSEHSSIYFIGQIYGGIDTETVSDSNNSSNGGGVYLLYSTFTVANDAIIKNCNASGHGGAIGVDRGIVNIEDNALISNNVAVTVGGIFITSDSILNMSDNSSISNNISNGIAGGLCATMNSSINITGGSIVNNVASTYGGGIYVDGSSLNISDALIQDNEADIGAGLLILNSIDSINISATFTGNKALSDGGAILVSESGSQININSDFDSNQAGDNGGAVYVDNSTIYVNSTFKNSQNITNATFGGAIYVSNSSSINVEGGSFEGLKATSAGGAITNLGNLDISGSEGEVIFDSCSAEMGGAIANSVYNSGSGLSVTLSQATATINNAVFTDNSATEGESNAIVNIGHMQLGGITQTTNDQDICIGRLSVLLGSIKATGSLEDAGIGGQTLYISFAKASLSDITDFSTIQLDTSATQSSFTYDVDGISFTEYSA